MPKINYKLASQRVNPGPGPGGLSPNLLSGAASTRTNIGPQISVNAANTRYSSLPVPKITVDTTLSSAAQASQVITQAAFDFQEKEAEVKANTVLLDLQKKIKGITREYGSLEGQAASENYSKYAEGIKSTIRQQIKSQEPKVRQKMVLQAKQLENSHLDAIAGHKTRQFKVWQATELENRQNEYINDLASFTDSKDVRGAIDAFNDNLVKEHGETFENRSEYTKKYQQDFKNRAYESIINTHINSGAFEKAENIIYEALDHGANKELLTKKGDQLERAIYSADLADARRRKAQDDLVEQQLEKQLNRTIMTAVNMDSVIAAEEYLRTSIDDAETLEDAFKIFTNIKKGLGSDDTAKARMYDQREALNTQPRSVLKEGRFPGVSWNDKFAFYNQMVSDRGTKVGRLRTEASKWAENIVLTAEGDFGFVMPGMQRQYDAAAAATKNRMLSFINDKIDTAVAKGESPEIAWQEAKAKILSDTKQFTYEQIEVQKNALAPINKRGESRAIGMYESGQSILNSNYDEQMTKELLDDSFLESATNLLRYYNINPNELVDTDFISVLNNIEDTDQLLDLIEDANQLLMQRRYFQQEIRGSKKSNNTDIDMSGFGL